MFVIDEKTFIENAIYCGSAHEYTVPQRHKEGKNDRLGSQARPPSDNTFSSPARDNAPQEPDIFDLNFIRMFVAVVEKKGIRSAAEELGIPKSTVSRSMTKLETHLGARLMERSTRSSRVTDAGLEYYRDCCQILEEIALANHALQRKLNEFCGQVRLSVPTRLGTDLFHDLAIEFARCHPDASLVLDLHDRSVNLIEERYDLAVCLGPAGADSSIVSRQIGTLSSSLYASRSYLLRHGVPQHPDALRHHQLLAFGKIAQPIVWQFKNKEQTVSLHAIPRLQCTDDELLIKWSASGLGICLVPDFMAKKNHSALVPVLPDWPHLSTEVRVSFVSHKSVTPLMRSVLDMLARLVPVRTEVQPLTSLAPVFRI